MDNDNLRQIVEYREPKDKKRKYAWLLPLKTICLTKELIDFIQGNKSVCVLFTDYIEETLDILSYMKHLVYYVHCDERWNKLMKEYESYILHRCFFNEEKLILVAKDSWLIPQYVQLKSVVINY